MANESSNVYAKIIDLGTYLDANPGTAAFIALIADKGPDNVATMVTSPGEYVKLYGYEDIAKLGKEFREGPIVARRYLAGDSTMYILRVLPEDAEYANIIVYADDDNGIPVVRFKSENGINSKDAIDTVMTTLNNYKPIVGIFAKYRGEWYNKYYINFRPVANPPEEDIYSMYIDIAEYNSEKTLVISRSYRVALDDEAVDLGGESLFIEHVLSFYDDDLTAKVNVSNIDFSQYYWNHELVEVVDYAVDPSEITANLDDDTVVLVGANATGDFAGQDNKIARYHSDTSSWAFEDAVDGGYYIIKQDYHDNSKTSLIATWDLATTTWTFSTPVYGMLIKRTGVNEVYYYNGLMWVKTEEGYILDAVCSPTNTSTDSLDYKKLNNGSSGSLIGANGRVDYNVATTLLTQAYLGQIDPSILNEQVKYFTIVFVPNYPRAVKDAAAMAAQLNWYKYAMVFTTVSDVNNPDKAIEERHQLAYNTFKVALYNNYSLITHDRTNRDIWVSPIVHMASVIPYNDAVGGIHKAPFNFNRASLVGIKELRYYPDQGDRDNLYLAQLNSVVKWADGYTIWEALTTQTRHSAMTDIPVVRTVLYIEKALSDFCRYYIAEDNTPETWNAVRREISAFLNELVAQTYIMGYNLEVGATDYERKTKRMHVNVSIFPKRFIEKVDLNLFIYS